jgi:anti-sigma factor RsiW
MCDFSRKLIAQMDGELLEGEFAELEQHLHACAECRNRLAAYKRASGAFDAYCEATFAAEMRRKSSRRLPAAVAVGAAAAVIAALLILPHRHTVQLPPRMSPPGKPAPVVVQPAEPPVTAANPEDAAHPIPSAMNRASRQHVAATVLRGRHVERETASAALVQSPPARNLSPFPPQPPIEIAIPADAMFPPGAVPPGMSFTAELTIEADGSPQQLGLRPRLAGFERSKNQP